MKIKLKSPVPKLHPRPKHKSKGKIKKSVSGKFMFSKATKVNTPARKMLIQNKVAKPVRKPKVESYKKLSEVSVDSFLSNSFSHSEESSSEDEMDKNESPVASDCENADTTQNGDASSDKESEEVETTTEETLSAHSHKKSLSNLKKTDPEFYKFLEENDRKLLQFQDSESDSEEEKEDNKRHTLPENLEVASDESDFEGDENEELAEGPSNVVTVAQVRAWQEALKHDKTVGTLSEVVKAFHAALQEVEAPNNKDVSVKYKVEGSTVFNAVVRLCVLDLSPAVKQLLKLPAGSSHLAPEKCKRWIKVKGVLKSYLKDVLKLLGAVSSPEIVCILLKHIHSMMPFIGAFKPVQLLCLKRLINLWSQGEETVRILAFLCIVRLTVAHQAELLDRVIKSMYVAYIQNVKFVSPNTWPAINFMRRSLTEIFSLDDAVAYQYMFVYIRQLAIHLRNAITMQKKDAFRAVYNWQYFHSMSLWTEILCARYKTSNQLQPLLYPLVQVITGTIKLVPTPRYFPLRFHCVRLLKQLSRSTGVFIPTLPFLLEVLAGFDFNKKHSRVSMKPLDMQCVLHLSKIQLQENGFKDATIDEVYTLTLEYLSSCAHSIGFPELVLPFIMQLKKFLKSCKNSNYCKKLRQVLDKIEENARFIENRRRKVTFSIADHKAIAAWEFTCLADEPPLLKFQKSFSAIRRQEVERRITGKDELDDYDIPVIKRKPGKSKLIDDGPVELFPSDESDEDDLGFQDDDEEEEKVEEVPKKKRRKEKKKKVKQPIKQEAIAEEDTLNVKDVIEDLALSDLE